MMLNFFKITLMGTALLVSVAAPLLFRNAAQRQYREKESVIAKQSSQLATLEAENLHLSNLVAQASKTALSPEQFHEFLRLRGEMNELRRDAAEAARLKAANAKWLAARTNSVSASAPSIPPPQNFQAYWPKTELAFAGYASPLAALQTALWAMSHGDPHVMAASVTPKAKSDMDHQNWYNHGTSEEEIASSTKQIFDSLNPTTGFYVVNQDATIDGQVNYSVYFAGEGKTRQIAVQKVGDEWRFDNLGGGLWP